MLSNFCLIEETNVGELSRNIGHLATCALLEEAGLEDKPGLVSPLSKGAHIDMDYALFENPPLHWNLISKNAPLQDWKHVN